MHVGMWTTMMMRWSKKKCGLTPTQVFQRINENGADPPEVDVFQSRHDTAIGNERDDVSTFKSEFESLLSKWDKV